MGLRRLAMVPFILALALVSTPVLGGRFGRAAAGGLEVVVAVLQSGEHPDGKESALPFRHPTSGGPQAAFVHKVIRQTARPTAAGH